MAGFLNALAFGIPVAQSTGPMVQNYQTIQQQQTNRTAFGKSLDALGEEGELYRQMFQQGASPESIIGTMHGDIGSDIKQKYIQGQINDILKTTPDPMERAWKIYSVTGDASLLKNLLEAERFGTLHPPPDQMKEELNNAIAVAKAHPGTMPPAAVDMLTRAAASSDPATIKAGYDMVTKGAFGASLFGYRVMPVPIGVDALGNPVYDYTYFPNRPGTVAGTPSGPPAAPPGAGAAGAPGATRGAVGGVGGAAPPTPPPVSISPPGSPGEPGGEPGAVAVPPEGGEGAVPGAEPSPGAEAVPSPAVGVPSAAASPAAGLPPSVPTTPPEEGGPSIPVDTPTAPPVPGGPISSGVRGTKIGASQVTAAQTVQALIGQVQSLQDRVNAIDAKKWDRNMLRRRLDYERLVYGGHFPEDDEVADLMDQTITVNRVAAAALAATAHMRAQAFIAGGEGHLPQAFYDKKAILRNTRFLLAPDGPYMSALRELGMGPLPRVPGLNIGPASPAPPNWRSSPAASPAAAPTLSPAANDVLKKFRMRPGPP